MNGPVTVIGGANMDINGFSLESLNMADSNPGKVVYCPGGVGRNIAENLCRLGTEVRFIGVIGDDPGGELLKNSSGRMGLNIEHSLFLSCGLTSKSLTPRNVTSVYIALMDSNGEMRLALADMDIMEEMTEEHLMSKAKVIMESAIVVLDANLPERIITFILDKFGAGLPGRGQSGGRRPLFFMDPVSARKAPRAASRIGAFDTLKLGRMEAAVLTGAETPDTRKELDDAASHLIGKGVRRVFITLGKEGAYAANARTSTYRAARHVQPLNTSGGGDAFMAGIVYGTLCGWDEETTVSFSLAMSRITVQSISTVSPEMSLELVRKNME